MNASHRDPFLITSFSIIVLVTPVLTYFCKCRLLYIGMRGDVDVGREKLILTINTAILIVVFIECLLSAGTAQHSLVPTHLSLTTVL